MALVFGNVRVYKDVNYTPGGREIPPAGSSYLPQEQRIFSAVKCAKDIFHVDLPVTYHDAISYTYIAVLWTTSPTRWFYGWITGIEQIAGVRDAVRISWELDYWRTFSSYVTFRRGRITRCPSIYPEYYRGVGTNVKPAIYSEVSDIDYLRNHSPDPPNPFMKDNWVLISVVTSGTMSSIEFWALPINGSVEGPSGEHPDYWTLSDIYSGRMDEILGILPNSIVGAWIIPFCPFSGLRLIGAHGSSGIGYFYQCTNPGIICEPRIGTLSGRIRSWVKLNDPSYLGVPGNVSFDPASLTITDDSHSLIQLNQAGAVAWAAPYYPPLDSTSLRIYQSVKVSGTDCSIIVIVTDRNDRVPISKQIRLGLATEIPAVSVPISSNAWSEYLYSGAREYDIESQKAQNEAAMYKGMLGASNSAMFGALAGTAVGNPIAGGIIGGIGQIVGSAIGGSVDESLRADLQEMKDHYVSQQANGLILPGGANTWIWASFNEGIRFASLNPANPDWDKDRTYYGEGADYPTDNFTLAGKTGPWQIQDMVISGEMPTEARIQISKMFQKGVYIIERNG